MMTTDERRAAFVLAQYFIEEGRYDEARLLLLSLDDVPIAQEWASALEYGHPVDTSAWVWEPEQIRPMPAPTPRQWTFKPGRVLLTLLMVLGLILPVVQPFLASRTPQPITPGRLRAEARAHLQNTCNAIALQAAREGRLVRDFGGCMEWSYRLTTAQMEDAVRCHVNAVDERDFRRCLYESSLTPPGIVPAADFS